LKTLEERISIAKWKVHGIDRFVFHLLSQFPLYIIKKGDPLYETVKTAATDYHSIFFNEDWCGALQDLELLFIVGHEIQHPLRKHDIRKNGRNHKKWNQATDYSINIDIVNSWGTKAKPPTGGCLDEKYQGMSSEEIYELLPDNAPSPLTTLLKLSETQEHGFSKKVKSTSDLQKETTRRIANALNKTAIDRQKEPGLGTSEYERIAGKALEPSRKWISCLKSVIQRKGSNRENWSKPNKRYSNLRNRNARIVLPSKKGISFGNLVLIIDTSGSVSTHELAQIIAEFNSLLKRSRSTVVTVICCDTKAYKAQTFKSPQIIGTDFKIQGGGGTDFRPAFEACKKIHKNTPVDQMIFYTDTMGVFPDHKPSYPVLFIVPEKYKNHSVPFGRKIDIPTY
jgi:predicted metal-dependent peptidase